MYVSAISKDSEGSFYALILRIDSDGQKNVVHGYKGRHFKTLKSAENSTSNYITKYELN